MAAVTTLRPKEIAYSSWQDVATAIDGLAGSNPYEWLFRGHEQASWPLAPALERVCAPEIRYQTERQLYEDFTSKAHLYTSHLPSSDDALSWMAAMQHHGIPTRLLDWTYSPYVALFFAVANQGEEDRAGVWAIHTSPLNERSRLNINQHFLVTNEDQMSLVFRKLGLLDPSTRSFGSLRYVMNLSPRFQVSRLSSQQGASCGIARRMVDLKTRLPR
jgi:hypothetical protein